mmetsp:Transcript_101141/g.159507  ORF Transcript_101141/g.159507 Transcript_101141/m.159507 type:complete len:85 (+) Transcript_101141:79-333(+)
MTLQAVKIGIRLTNYLLAIPQWQSPSDIENMERQMPHPKTLVCPLYTRGKLQLQNQGFGPTPAAGQKFLRRDRPRARPYDTFRN